MKSGHPADGFVQRELIRLEIAITQTPPGLVSDLLQASQQALRWATEPSGYASPFDAIARRHGVMDIPADSEDYFPRPDPSQF